MARYERSKQHDDKLENPVFVDDMLQKYRLDKQSDKLFRDTQRCITSFISELHKHIVAIDGEGRFVGKVEEIGSAAEGVYTSTSDLDYLIVLKNSHTWLTNQADIRRILPLTNKPSNATKKSACQRSIFEITFNNSSPDLWEKFMSCDECRKIDTECNKAHQFRSLRGSSIQEEYERLVNEVVNTGVLSNEITINDTRKCGPAVTLDITYKGFSVSVDLTVAFEVATSSPCWPFNEEEFKLRDVRNHLTVCHMVAAGNNWKLSFALAEREMMSPNDKDTLRVMKIIREKERANISSYSLKTAVLKMGNDNHENSHLADTITSTVIEMAEESTDTGQSSAFVKDYLVTPRDDSMFPEPWRILDHLHKLRSVCYREGVIHTLLWTLLLGLVSTFFIGMLYMTTLSKLADCLVFSDIFSIGVTVRKECIPRNQMVQNATCYHQYDILYHTAIPDQADNMSVGIFTYGFPWGTSNLNHLHDSDFASHCQANSTQIECISKCLRSKYLCDTERHLLLCRKAFLLLHVICTYLIFGLCVVGMVLTRDKQDRERVTLYETYKGLQRLYITMFVVSNVWATLTTVMYLQATASSYVFISYSFLFCLLLNLFLGLPLIAVGYCIIEGSNNICNPVTMLYYTVLAGLVWWQNLHGIMNDVNPEMNYSWIDAANMVLFVSLYSMAPLCVTCQLYISHVSKQMLSFVLKLFILVYVIILIVPVAVTILWTSGTLLLFGCVHIVLSCVRGKERPKIYPHRTVQNQSYWCFQPIFVKYASLYCVIPVLWNCFSSMDKKINRLILVCVVAILVLCAIAVVCSVICLLVFLTYFVGSAMFNSFSWQY